MNVVLHRAVLVSLCALLALTAGCSRTQDADEAAITSSMMHADAHPQRAAVSVVGATLGATPPGMTVAAGYLTIQNTGTHDVRLIAAQAEIATSVSLHESSVADGMARMRTLADGILIPAGASVALEPGQRHLMFQGLKQPLKAGEHISVALTFAPGGPINVEFTVR